jgi:hypothetical protein
MTSHTVNARGQLLFDDPRFRESDKDRSEPPFYRYREYGHYEYEIVGRDGSHFTSHYSERSESFDLFEHGRGYLFEEGVKDIDEAVDLLNEQLWRAEGAA